MRALLAFILAVAAAVTVGILLSREPGYVLVAYGTTRVEFTLFAFLLIYLAALLAGGGLWTLVRRLRGMPGGWRRMRAGRARRRAETMYASGLVALAEGRLAIAERALEYAARGALTLPALLAAARAADHAGARERRDRYLQQAWETYPKAAPAVLLTQAELDLDRGDYEHALAALQKLRGTRGAHPLAVRDLARVYAALGDHAKLIGLLPELSRGETVSDEELERLAADAVRGVFTAPGSADPASQWRRLPARLRERPAVRRAAAAGRAATGDAERAGDLLARNLKDAFDPESVRSYAALDGIPAGTRMRMLERWLERYGDEPVLLTEAARVALDLSLWGQARSYLEQARSHGAGPEAALLAGRIAEREGRSSDALACYRDGLQAAVPAPDGR